MSDVLILIAAAVLFACCIASFFAGFKAAQAYLGAANGVLEASKALAESVNRFRSALDSDAQALSSFTSALEAQTRTVDQRLQFLEEVVSSLRIGLEGAGVARPARASVPRQHGEGPLSTET